MKLHALILPVLCWCMLVSGCTPEGVPAPDTPSTSTTTTTAPAEPPPPPPLVCEATSRTSTRAFAGDRLERAQERIVGGIEARPGAWPWAAAIAFRVSGGQLFQYCGGSLIAPDWILTAAHCQVEVGDTIVLGRHDLRQSDGEEIRVDAVLTHARYNSFTSDNDIALVHLESPSSSTPVALIGADELGGQPGDIATVIGWGALWEGGATSKTLQQVDIPVVSNPECAEVYDELTPNMICAGEEMGGEDSCQGDSGGPLMVISDGEWAQNGIVSFGVGCARPGIAGVYTRVARYLDWVEACAR